MALRDTHHYSTKPKSDLPAMLSKLELSKRLFYVDSPVDSVSTHKLKSSKSHFYVDSTSARTLLTVRKMVEISNTENKLNKIKAVEIVVPKIFR